MRVQFAVAEPPVGQVLDGQHGTVAGGHDRIRIGRCLPLRIAEERGDRDGGQGRQQPQPGLRAEQPDRAGGAPRAGRFGRAVVSPRRRVLSRREVHGGPRASARHAALVQMGSVRHLAHRLRAPRRWCRGHPT